MKALFALSLLFAFTSAKSFAGEPLPRPIIEMQNTKAVQGTCQKEWMELTESYGVTVEKLEPAQTLYIVPCAMWADNVAYSVFVTIKESSHPDGFLTKQMSFVNFHPYEGIIARDVIHNVKWESATKTLKAFYMVNGNTNCGSRSVYKWSGGYQDMHLVTLLKQSKCDDPTAPWLPVFTSATN